MMPLPPRQPDGQPERVEWLVRRSVFLLLTFVACMLAGFCGALLTKYHP